MFSSLKLKEICTAQPICIDSQDTVASALQHMEDMRISAVVVLDENRPVGLFTERDAVKIIALGGTPDATRVQQVMHHPLITAPWHLDFFEAYHLCAEKNVRHLVVLDDQENLFGIATSSDFMRALGMDVLSGQETVRHLMSTDEETVAPNAPLQEAVAMMARLHCHAIVVADKAIPVGILTERDLVRHCRLSTPLDTVVSQLMTSPVITSAPENSIYAAIEMMRQQQIRCLAVVNQGGQYIGTLHQQNIVKQIEQKYIGLLTTVIKRQADDIQRIQHELDETHVLSAVLHQSLGVGLIVADIHANIRYINPCAADLFGISSEGITGSSLYGLFELAGMPDTVLLTAHACLEHGTDYEYELTRTGSPDKTDLHLRFAPIRDSGGKFLGLVLSIQDVSEKKKTEHKLKQAASIFENTIEGVIIADAQANIISVNPAFTRITGYDEDEVRGKNPRILSSGRQPRSFYETMWGSLLQEGYWQGEIWNRRKNGETYAEWLTISAMQGSSGKPNNYIAVFADITSAKRVHDEFEYLAHHDPLTGLANRLLFKARLTHSISRASRNGCAVAVLMIDLDGFKQINDRYGHQVGDDVLELVATRLKASTREEDTVARLGGDEFVILLEDLDDLELAEQIGAKLIDIVSQPMQLDGEEVCLTASVGIAFSEPSTKNPETVLSRADKALYNAKNAGKNTCHTYDS